MESSVASHLARKTAAAYGLPHPLSYSAKYIESESLSTSANMPTSWSSATLEEIAGLIQDVGIESLCKQLGLDSNDCSF